jgi:hypothetical protein
MSNKDIEQAVEFQPKSEHEILQEQADKLGISYRSNISTSALKEKIQAQLNESRSADPQQFSDVDALTSLRLKATELVRVVISPVCPRRIQLDGEIVTVGNGKIGMHSKYVPFNLEQGYHLPRIILDHLRTCKFNDYYTTTDENRNQITKARSRKAFIIDELEPLTQAEIDVIAARQKGTLEEE